MTFEKPTRLQLLATRDETTNSEFRSSMVFIDSFRRLPEEIRIRVGHKQPRQPIRVSASLPKAFLAEGPQSHQVVAWVQIDQGDMDNFEVLPFFFSAKDSAAVIELPEWAFTNSRPFSRHEYEAIVIVGTAAPGTSESDEKDRNISSLQLELEKERNRTKELSAKLDALRQQLAGEPVSVQEIVAVPEQYLDKEIVLEGVWLMSGFTFETSTGNFILRYKHSNAQANCYFDKDKLDPRSRRILISKPPGQLLRARGYLRDASKQPAAKTSASRPNRAFGYYLEVVKIED